MDSNFAFNNHIRILSSSPGSGKTNAMLEWINDLPEGHSSILFVTPFLTEIQRVIENTNKNFKQPNSELGGGRKKIHLKQLLLDGENICTTHAMLQLFDESILSIIRSMDYILILDEVVSCIYKYNQYEEHYGITDNQEVNSITKRDVKTLLDKGIISVAADYQVSWVSEEETLFKYSNMKSLADEKRLFLINESLLCWMLPESLFQGMFEQVFILTFQFRWSLMKGFFDFYGIKYDTYHVENNGNGYEIVESHDLNHELEWIECIKPLINIVGGKINKIGSYYMSIRGVLTKTALSKNWFRNNEGLYKKVSNNSINYIRNIAANSSNSDVIWTCFLEHQSQLKNSRTTLSNWIPLNSRATNEFGERSTLIYNVNLFLNPFYFQLFLKKGIEFSESQWALSSLLQWILRSRLRNAESIDLFIPSKRMRTILCDFLNLKLF